MFGKKKHEVSDEDYSKIKIFEERSKNRNIESKYTFGLIILLSLLYIAQILFIDPNVALSNQLKTNTAHLFEGNFISVVTAIFMHGSFVHLFANIVALLIFGRIVEKTFGWKMLLIFLFSGIIANVVSNIIAYSSGSIYYSLGASGGIAGLIIFATLLEPLTFTKIFIFPIPVFVIGWALIISDIIGFTNPTSNINYLAHLSGYGALLILFAFLEMRHKKKIFLGFSINLAIILGLYLILRIIGFENLGI